MFLRESIVFPNRTGTFRVSEMLRKDELFLQVRFENLHGGSTVGVRFTVEPCKQSL